MDLDPQKQIAAVERRGKLYIGDRPRPEIAGKTAIIVNDGIATGATVRARRT
jgi:predicted phosphoribosyltransferase